MSVTSMDGAVEAMESLGRGGEGWRMEVGDAGVSEKDGLLDRIRLLEEALTQVTDHFAAVMGGPMMSGLCGITFPNGVEGIPTIAKAREVLKRTS